MVSSRTLTAMTALMFLSACSPSYPKKNLEAAVNKLVREEMDVEVQSHLSGHTLCVLLPNAPLVDENRDLSDQPLKLMETALMSASRAVLSSDAKIDFIVVKAEDPELRTGIRIIRRVQDLKDLYFWKISQDDFGDRLALEVESGNDTDANSSALEQRAWPDLTLPEFAGLWVASRINQDIRSNAVWTLLLDTNKVKPRLDYGNKTLYLTANASGKDEQGLTGGTTVFLRDIVIGAVKQAYAKYGAKDSRSPNSADWFDTVKVQDRQGRAIFEIRREDWTKAGSDGEKLSRNSIGRKN